jgi:Family of unknown function (DUF6445)
MITIDGFLDDPHAERDKALSARYETIDHNALKYRGISFTDDEKSVARISDIVGYPLVDPKVMWRRYVAEEKNETYIHSDVQIGNFTAILYLNPPDKIYGGTAFWKHRKYGWNRQPTLEELEARGLKDTPELWNQIHQDGFDEKKWDMTDMVGMRFNRLLIFESPRFHSRWPMQAFGSDIESARLIKVFFLWVKK